LTSQHERDNKNKEGGGITLSCFINADIKVPALRFPPQNGELCIIRVQKPQEPFVPREQNIVSSRRSGGS